MTRDEAAHILQQSNPWPDHLDDEIATGKLRMFALGMAIGIILTFTGCFLFWHR